MKILVTGGAGYIGSILVEALLREHKVTVVDNFMYGQISLAHLCRHENLTIIRGDSRDLRLMRPLLQSFDLFIPLAAIVGQSACELSPENAQSTNAGAIYASLLFLSKEQKVLIPITNSGYGVGEKDAYCTEESPLRPLSLYGRTKIDAEKAALDFGSAISLRLATVFGMSPRMRLDLLVNDFTWRAVRDGSLIVYEGHFRRNFIHVRDVATAFQHAIQNWGEMVKTPIYNVGHTRLNMTKLELCELIKNRLPRFNYFEGEGEDPDKRDYIVSNKRIESTGWYPNWGLTRGVDELVKGYKMFRAHEHGNV